MPDRFPRNVVLIEDNPGDIELIRKVLSTLKIPTNLEVLTDGEAALKWASSAGEAESDMNPDLILLDLNLPKRSGREVLEAIKNCVALKHTPVIVLTSSNADHDVVYCYESHVNAYVIKPLDIADFFALGKAIEDFWFRLNYRPSPKYRRLAKPKSEEKF